MIRTPTSARAHRSREWRSEWTLVRAWLSLLTMAAAWLSQAEPGPMRRYGLKLVRHGVGGLEKALRYLLLLMRAPVAAPKPATFHVRDAGRNQANAKQPGRVPRFSLSLSQYTWLPPETALAKAPAPEGRAPARPAPDKARALAARLAAMRSVLADPAPFESRIAAAARARGLSVRRPAPLIPASEIWTLFQSLTPCRNRFQLAARQDSSG